VVNQYFHPGELFFSFGMRLLPGSSLAELSGIPEREMIYPIFWPFNESCFDYVINHLDKRFLRFNTLARVSSWRKAYHDMQLIQFPGIDTPILKRPVAL
jgi:hypothetical protein